MKTQVAIVGGGPAGSACAIRLAMRGIASVIVEKEAFPRFHIGESLTAESGSLLREMGLEEAMIARKYPVKHGIRIYGPAGRSQLWIPVKSRDPVLGLKETFTWQVRRSSFDNFLLERAVELGTTVVRARAVGPRVADDGAVRGLTVEMESGGAAEIGCDVLVDASGQRTFLAGLGLTGAKHRGAYDNQVAVYSHFTGATLDEGDQWGNTVMFFREKNQWAWMIPIDDQVTSIGLVVPADYFQSRSESMVDFLSREFRTFNKELARRVERVERVEEVRATSNYSYRVDRFSGKGWLCIGDAHRFIDPLFSFGVNIAMAEARQAALAISRFLDGDVDDADRPFLAYEEWSNRGVGVCQTILDGFWNRTFVFGLLVNRYQEDFIDMLAGRVWDDPEYHALSELRKALAGQHGEKAAEYAV